MIKEKLMKLEDRETIPKYKKYQEKENKYSKEKPQLLYEYYLCDNDGEVIKITKKIEERTGGIVKLPVSFMGLNAKNVVLCNKCYKGLIEEAWNNAE